MPRIVVMEDGERTTHDLDRTSARVGRDASNDVVVRDAFVSARHGELRWDAGGIWYEDFVTTNGSRVWRGGDVLPVDASCGHRVRLREGDELLLGDKRRPIRLLLESGQQASRSPPKPAASGRDVAFGATCGETLALMGAGLPRESLLALHRLALRCGGQPEPASVLKALSDAVLEALPSASLVAAWLCEQPGGRLMPPVTRTRRADALEAPPLGSELRRRVLARGEAIAFHCAGEGEAASGALAGTLAVPLWDGRDVLGIIVAAGSPGRAMEAAGLELLALMAHQAALSLSLAVRASAHQASSPAR